MGEKPEREIWYYKRDAGPVEVLARFVDPSDGKERVVYRGRPHAEPGYQVYSKVAFEDHYVPERPLLEGVLYWSRSSGNFYLLTGGEYGALAEVMVICPESEYVSRGHMDCVPEDAVEAKWSAGPRRFRLIYRDREG